MRSQSEDRAAEGNARTRLGRGKPNKNATSLRESGGGRAEQVTGGRPDCLNPNAIKREAPNSQSPPQSVAINPKGTCDFP